MSTALKTVQAVLITAAIGIGVYAIVSASVLAGDASNCDLIWVEGGAGETGDYKPSATCGVTSGYGVQAIAMVAWALFAVALTIAALVLRSWGRPASPRPPQAPQQWGPPTGAQPIPGQWQGQPGAIPPR